MDKTRVYCVVRNGSRWISGIPYKFGRIAESWERPFVRLRNAQGRERRGW